MPSHKVVRTGTGEIITVEDTTDTQSSVELSTGSKGHTYTIKEYADGHDLELVVDHVVALAGRIREKLLANGLKVAE